MNVAPITLFGNGAASDATLFTSLATPASLRPPPRLHTQAKIAEQWIAANPGAPVASLRKMAQPDGRNDFSHSPFHSAALRSADGGWTA
jgi:hypothetical protein